MKIIFQGKHFVTLQIRNGKQRCIAFTPVYLHILIMPRRLSLSNHPQLRFIYTLIIIKRGAFTRTSPRNEIIYDELRPCPHTWCTIAVAKEAGKGGSRNAIIRINIAGPVVRIRGSGIILR